MRFTLEEIGLILAGSEDEADILSFLERRKTDIGEELSQLRNISRTLDDLIRMEKEYAKVMSKTTFEIEEKDLPTMLIAGLRFTGKYSDTGKYMGTLCRKAGPVSCGGPFNLYYDAEYREDDADIESCIPIRKERKMEGIEVRELEGGRAITLIHKGPYETIGGSYARLFDYLKEKGLEPILPLREVYLKGPGMLLKGNPKNYLTEIQVRIG
jgi:effector-binding domain-containing protein